MENRKLLISVVAALFAWACSGSLGLATTSHSPTSFLLSTDSIGGELSSAIQASSTDRFGRQQNQIVPLGEPQTARCGYWSAWNELGYNAGTALNPSTAGTWWGVDLFDSCLQSVQVFPNGPTPCLNFSPWPNRNPQGPPHFYSLCYFFQPGHIPAGLGMSSQCSSTAEADSYLSAALAPPNYDPKTPAQLQLVAQFKNGFTTALSDGTCSSALSWDVTGWTVQWPDGQTQNYPGSGQQPLDVSYTTIPNQPGTGQAVVTSHVHVHGIFQDFDAAGNLFLNQGDATVDVTNSTVATAAQYVPPVLNVGAVGEGQQLDGLFNSPLGALPTIHVDTTYGRLLKLFPRPVIVRPGYELIAGVNQGPATTTAISWTFLGPVTDTPATETTLPGTTLPDGSFMYIQYNHAEPIGPTGQPQDETVRFTEQVTSTYPDGTSMTTAVTGAIAVTIFYAGLNFTG